MHLLLQLFPQTIIIMHIIQQPAVQCSEDAAKKVAQALLTLNLENSSSLTLFSVAPLKSEEP